ncbi:hypothetical protein [Pseudanabaena sp. PCC 6802]|uniref:hypothetical protein n=1 Tax=Pseudanabaena sp. PCC 6802 TaxID=118173 RepID=UPI000344E69A|nr:hypothetical protein [Pseudanabaena sp. PCC 6802]
MSNINISDLDVNQDFKLLAECSPDEASIIEGGFWAEILGAVGATAGAIGGGVLGGAAGAYFGYDLGRYLDEF